MNVKDLEPKECFAWFEKIAKIPHGSHNEKQISDFLMRFAEERGLHVTQDQMNNICIKKEAAKGMEKAPAVILQGHMDMVCVKENDKSFDFTKDPIAILTDGDTIWADGTTLGADNGIGLSYILALLDSKDIPHPALEAVITTQEEVGMSGANSFDVSGLTGKYFINLDSEDEGVFCLSCAGGRRSTVSLPIIPVAAEDIPDYERYTFFTIHISGLTGGHSGMEIAAQRGNANRLAGRILAALSAKYGLYLTTISGGSATNVIPSEATMTIFTTAPENTLRQDAHDLREIFADELSASDGGGLVITVRHEKDQTRIFSRETTERVTDMLTLLPDGVVAMNLHIAGQKMVASSTNLGLVETKEDCLTFSSLTRSSVRSQKEFICFQIARITALTGAQAKFFGDYPAWEFNPESRLLPIFQEAYTELFNKESRAEGIHAGLECGLFFEKFKALGRHMDFIAFGPDISGAHTTKESTRRASVENMWKLLKKVLLRLGEME